MVPCTVEQRDGRTWGPLVAAGKTVAAEAAEVFVVVMRTEQRGEENWVKVFVVTFLVGQQLRVRPTPPELISPADVLGLTQLRMICDSVSHSC